MVGRQQFIEQLIETVELLITDIEDRETIDPDLAIVREFAEQLLEEVESLDE